ncbi:uncharacterized protein LOC108677953 [Hyalella azteca]|uniref:Uncharacterized protein LOC108677953 n=1 Tax=Hyalella azteca TaxID=294128 RepID=A0A8B7P718_HYAAZ|nr:uncharacterized protein LOC108677953 [Hyalella azteca]
MISISPCYASATPELLTQVVPCAGLQGCADLLVDTSPPLQGSAGLLVDTSPPPQDSAGLLVDTSPPLQDSAGLLVDTSPPLQGSASLLVDTSPPLQDSAGLLVDTSPPLQGSAGLLVDTSSPLQGSAGLQRTRSSAKVSDAKCTDPLPTMASATSTLAVDGEMIVYTCDSKQFNTGDSAVVVYCVDGRWQNTTGITCTMTDVGACTPSSFSPDDTSMVVDKRDTNFATLKCANETLKWLSGEPRRLTQCRAGTWTPIMDLCDQACPIPRDCHEVEELGFNRSDFYIVVPTGQTYDASVKVYCELSLNDTAGGHWTRILSNNASNFVDATGSQWETGFNATDPSTLFMGLRHVSALTRELNGTLRPHVLEVILQVGTVEYFASYGNFTLGSVIDKYPIQSLGTYHGNAGDGLCPHVHMGFNRDTTNIGWWGDLADRDALITEEDGCLLTNSSMIWQPLASKGAVTSVRMRMCCGAVGCGAVTSQAAGCGAVVGCYVAEMLLKFCVLMCLIV